MKIALDVRSIADAHPETCLAHARAWGFDGLVVSLDAAWESSGAWADALCTPDAWLGRSRDHGLTPVAIHTGLALDAATRAARRGVTQRIRATLDAAARAGFGRVIVMAASPTREPLERSLERTTSTLGELLAADAKEPGADRMMLLLDNRGTGLTSRELWHLRDAVNSARVRYAFSPHDGQARHDPPSVSIKRLAGALDLVWLSAVDANRAVAVADAAAAGGEVEHTVELLRGLAFEGWLCISGPDSTGAASAAAVLSEAVRSLRALLARPTVVLSAYKGDRHAPRYRPRSTGPSAAGRP